MAESEQHHREPQPGAADRRSLLVVAAFGVLATMGAVVLITSLAGRSPVTIDASEVTVPDVDIDTGAVAGQVVDRAADAAVEAAIDAATDQVADAAGHHVADAATSAADGLIDEVRDTLVTTTTTLMDSTASTEGTTTAAPIPEAAVTIGLLPSGATLVQLVGDHEGSQQQGEGEGCPVAGHLALRNKVGTIFHRYEMSSGSLEYREGPYGQVALIERCDGSVGRILLLTTSGLSAEAVPPLVVWDRPADVAAVTDPGWLGITGHFAVEATLLEEDDDGAAAIWTETLVIDASDGSSLVWAEVFGERVTHALVGLDVVVPHRWTAVGIDDEHTSIVLQDPLSDSYVTIDVAMTTGASPTPTALGDETLVDVANTTVSLWEQLIEGKALRSGVTDATDHRFAGSGGDRVVRTILPDGADGARFITIEAFTDGASNLSAGDLPMLIVDGVRVLTTVG